MRAFHTGLTGITSVLISFAVAALASGAAPAQDAAPNPFLSPEETRVCLCLENEINGMDAELETSRQPRENVAAEFARLDALVQQARETIDVNDEAEMASFRRLFDRREELRQQLDWLSRPYNQILGRHNKLARAFNSQCANRTMFKVNVDAARADLHCEPAQ